jgi:predicted PurR-regulated permease PerM
MPPQASESRQQLAATTVVMAIAVAALYFGRELFVPVSLAILLSFVLAPLVRALQRVRCPKLLSVVAVVMLAFAGIFAIGGLIATELTQLAGDLPRYESTMRHKIQSLRGPPATTTLEKAADVLKDLGNELNRPKSAPTATFNVPAHPDGQETKPIPVEVRQPPPTALESIASLISPLLQPLTTTGIIAIFVVFILLQREDLRNRFIKLVGTADLQRTTVALDDAAGRLSRFFLFQLALNTGFGAIVGLGLWMIGVPSPALWGVLAAIVRFVPYVGAIIAAAFPLTLAAAVDPGWSMLLWTAVLFLTLEPLVGQFIEPLAFGHSTGLTPIAIVASATFWTALWGPIGLVLATPLTVCLVVLGRHVEQLKFLDVMLGDRPPLEPRELFYQRMLAGDPAEAVEKAEEFLKERPLSSFYDDVAIPGLLLAQRDLARGALDREQTASIKTSVAEMVDSLDYVDAQRPSANRTLDAEASATLDSVSQPAVNLPVLNADDLSLAWQVDCPVVCMGARSPLDEAAALLLAQLLIKHGLRARIEPPDSLAFSNIAPLEAGGTAMIYVCYLDPSKRAHMRYSITRLRRRYPEASIVLACWGGQRDDFKGADPDRIATSLSEALACAFEAAQLPKQNTPALPESTVPLSAA